jgi:proteasome lid subunit RPN8/RPN11
VRRVVDAKEGGGGEGGWWRRRRVVEAKEGGANGEAVGLVLIPWEFVLSLSTHVHRQILGHCLSGLPNEACGLVAGDSAAGHVSHCFPTRNVAASAKLYTVDPREHLQAELEAEKLGLELIGVFHSHTHTDAYPSRTDVEQASTPLSDPRWHYVLVSLRDTHPVLRAYRIVDGQVNEESVVVEANAPR